MEKKLSEITRSEWIAFRWIEIESVMGDDSDERMFQTEGKRTPDEAAQAALDWDSTAEERAEYADIEE
jgi:hypothetical protein